MPDGSITANRRVPVYQEERSEQAKHTVDEVHAWHKQDFPVYVHHRRDNIDFEADDF